MTDSNSSNAPHPTIDALLAGYMERVDSGEDVDREEFLRQSSEYADELRELLDAADLIDRIVKVDGIPRDIHNQLTWAPGDPGRSKPMSRDHHALTSNQFMSALEKSKLLSPEQIETVRHGDLGDDEYKSASSIAERLVEQKLLTEWQAEQLLAREQIFFLGPYRLLKLLGRGGMGIVYAAYDRKWHQTVALKTLRYINPTTIYHIKQEFRVLANLTHPNLVQLFELSSDRDQHFLTMEIVEGVDFVSHCREQLADVDPGADNFSRLRNAFQQLSAGLNTLHQSGFLHCDIKPSNVLVTATGHVTLLDFGLAQRDDRDRLLAAENSYLKGTAAYISPEQFEGESASVQSDWYSVGVILYEVLTGRLPFSGTLSEVSVAKRTGKLKPPVEFNSEVPEDLNSLCIRLLHRSPQLRFGGEDTVRMLVPNSRGSTPILLSSGNIDQNDIFVGRELELNQLQESFQQTQGRQQSICHFVCGDSGVGKTSLLKRLVSEFSQCDDTLVFSGRCYEQESISFKALDYLVDEICQHLRNMSPGEAASLLPENVDALTQMFPVLGSVKAVRASNAKELAQQDPQRTRQLGQRAFTDLLRRIAEGRQLVLCIDDLQWGDRDSAELLSEAFLTANHHAILFIGCYRSDSPSHSAFLSTLKQRLSQANRKTEWRVLPLDDLPLNQARDLARRLLAEDGMSGPRSIEAVVRESGGNPYLMQEIVRFADQTTLETSCNSQSVEKSVDEILWDRVAQLPLPVRKLLEIVAIAGHPLCLRVAIQATRVSVDFQKSFSILRAAGFVRTFVTDGHVEFVEPKHDRIREGVTRQIPDDIQCNHHLQLALTLESMADTNVEHLALHYHAARYTNRACEYALLAAEQAAQGLAFDSAAEFYRIVLETHSGAVMEKGRVHRLLADVLASAGRGSDAAEQYLQALTLCRPEESNELRRLAASQLLKSGRFDEGMEVLSSLLKTAGLKIPKTAMRAIVQWIGLDILLRLRRIGPAKPGICKPSSLQLEQLEICWTAFQIAPYDMIKCLPIVKRHALMALEVGEPKHMAIAHANEAVVVAAAGPRCSKRAEKLMAIGRSFADQNSDFQIHGYLDMAEGQVAMMQGGWQRTSQLCTRADKHLQNTSQAVWLESSSAANFNIIAMYYLGRLSELRDRVHVLIEKSEKLGDAYGASVFRMNYANIAWLLDDDRERAHDELAKAKSLWPMHKYSYHQMFESIAEFHLHLYSEDTHAAWQCAEKWWPVLKSCGAMRFALGRVKFHFFRASCALASAQNGHDSKRLLRIATADVRKMMRDRLDMAPGLAQLILGQMAIVRGDLSVAVHELRASVDCFDRLDMAFHAAVTRRRYGELVGGDEGKQMVNAADSYMAAQNIKNPSRMTAIVAPIQAVGS